jgi:hypothetical protein
MGEDAGDFHFKNLGPNNTKQHQRRPNNTKIGKWLNKLYVCMLVQTSWCRVHGFFDLIIGQAIGWVKDGDGKRRERKGRLKCWLDEWDGSDVPRKKRGSAHVALQRNESLGRSIG